MSDHEELHAILHSAQEGLAQIDAMLEQLATMEREIEAKLAQGRKLLALEQGADALLSAADQAKLLQTQADMEQLQHETRAQKAELKALQADLKEQCQNAAQALKRLGAA